MRTTTIPAQITTVEDTIAGSLTMRQVILLINPIMCAIVLYMVFPPFFHFSLIKISIEIIYALISLLLAIRVKSKLIIDWIQILTVYSSRPRYYMFNKNDSVFRKVVKEEKTVEKEENKVTYTIRASVPSFVPFLEKLSIHPNFHVVFKPIKKGGMHVAIYNKVQK